MELDEEEAGSRMHLCRGLSGLHLLPALTRNLGILLTARALRKLQENGVVNRHVRSLCRADVFVVLLL